MKTEKEKREEEEEDLRPFRIHAYSKEELAMLYNPTYCISNAIYTLAAWIRHNKALKGELEKVGVQQIPAHLHSAGSESAGEVSGENPDRMSAGNREAL